MTRRAPCVVGECRRRERGSARLRSLWGAGGVAALALMMAACRDSASGGPSGQLACGANEISQGGACVPASGGATLQPDSGVPPRPSLPPQTSTDAGHSVSPPDAGSSGGAALPDAGSTTTSIEPDDSTGEAGGETENPPTMPPPPAPAMDAFDPNAAGLWHDTATNLYWENPPMQRSIQLPNFAQARSYCEDLVLAGASDWRVPTLDELRTLVRGISTVMTGGACPTSEACANSNDCNRGEDACLGCSGDGANVVQPGDCALTENDLSAGHCYWADGLEGECTAYWSATVNTAPASAGRAMYYLRYENGIIRSLYGPLGNFAVRCVRR